MSHPRPRKNLRRILRSSIITVLLVAGLTVLLAIRHADDLVRYSMMNRLCSSDPAKRDSAVMYVIAHINEPATLDRAKSMLDGADDACFDNIVRALAAAGAWGPGVGRPWLRYLSHRVDSGIAIQRSAIAVELGKTLWQRRPYHDDPSIPPLIEKLMIDKEPDVRFNALSAAACLPEPQRSKLLEQAASDPEAVIADHANIMLKLLAGEPPVAPGPDAPAATANEMVKRLAALESMPTNSTRIEITPDMPDLIRLQAVRVSQTAMPDDLRRVFNADQPTTRDLAVLTAIDRFTPDQCRELAKELIMSFEDNSRMAGAMLGGMVEPDDDLMKFLKLRAEKSESWIVQQHYNLALLMQGQTVDKFDPVSLLAQPKVPRTTITMALLYLGNLEGADWMFNPFGDPPVALELLFDQLRYWPVVHHFLPGAPKFNCYAAPELERQQVDVLRDWYLLMRPGLRFDTKTHTFAAPIAGAAPVPENRP
ncbi:MAG: hypothetical protein GC162_18650 [Planctomycetes bacterium]|nr:hypothetical protein [Planctomycetota bacterium]